MTYDDFTDWLEHTDTSNATADEIFKLQEELVEENNQ